MSRPLPVLGVIAASLVFVWLESAIGRIPLTDPARAAMRIAMDPETGRPTAPEYSGSVLSIVEMQDLARREAEGLVTIVNPDGSETLDHAGRFTDYSVIRLGPDGRPSFRCVHGAAGVAHALRPAAPATPKLEDR